ncbi:hypothetical protein RAA17_13825 [Komagataeibacter rhaeticus]|nr:hypothetical protein [Komagataeibacter rhaeticus]
MPALLELARTQAGSQLWHTARLCAFVPDADAYATQAAGAMVVPISSQPGIT